MSNTQRRTVLITGTSSGIGRACVDAFASAGWNVLATMRSPERHAAMARPAEARAGAVELARLDVTEQASIDAAFAIAIERFGSVDCVVNNAGYALTGVFEEMSDEQLRCQFDTNVLGVLRVSRSAIAHMRPRRAGTIVNVTSMGGRLAFPLYSPYHATKWAVEGFSESLQYELRQFGIRVRIAEPGPVRTEFYGGSMTHEAGADIDDYGEYVGRAMMRMNASGAGGASPERVARSILRAAQSRSWRLRWPTDGTSRLLLTLRALLPQRAFAALVRRATGG